MKKLFLLTLALLMILLSSCNILPSDADMSDSAPTDESELPSETAYDPSVIKESGRQMLLILPTSKKEIGINGDYREFAPYITYELVDAAEKDILDKRGTLEHTSFEIKTNSEGYLRLSVEYIKSVDPEMIANGYERTPPCGDHWHLHCGGVISSQPIEKFKEEISVPDDLKTIKAMSDLIVETSQEPIETSPSADPDGDDGDLIPVEQLRRADMSKIENLRLSFDENSEAIIVFFRGKGRVEKCVVITPEVMMIVETGFGHPRQFSYLNSTWPNKIISAHIISPEDYRRCKLYTEVLSALKEADADSVAPESDFNGYVYYGYMTSDSFEVYNKKTLEKIFEESGRTDSYDDPFNDLYERFGVEHIINS